MDVGGEVVAMASHWSVRWNHQRIPARNVAGILCAEVAGATALDWCRQFGWNANVDRIRSARDNRRAVECGLCFHQIQKRVYWLGIG